MGQARGRRPRYRRPRRRGRGLGAPRRLERPPVPSDDLTQPPHLTTGAARADFPESELYDNPTAWSKFRIAEETLDSNKQRDAAWERFFVRCRAPVLRYLSETIAEDKAAHELFTRFYEQLVAGSFRGVDRSRGRLRDDLKRALFNLVADYRQNQRSVPVGPVGDVAARASSGGDPEGDEALFLRCYREGLMDRAFAYLEEREQRDGRPYSTVLRLALADPAPKAAEIARTLSERTGRSLTESWVRGIRRQARDAFKDFLLQQIRESLSHPTAMLVEDELVEIGLYKHLKKHLWRQRRSED